MIFVRVVDEAGFDALQLQRAKQFERLADRHPLLGTSKTLRGVIAAVAATVAAAILSSSTRLVRRA